MRTIHFIAPVLGIFGLLSMQGVCQSRADQAIASRKVVQTFFAETKYGRCVELTRAWRILPPSGKIGLLEALAESLTSRREAAFSDVSDMAVWHRVAAGRMKFDGMGVLLKQDVFIEGGRAAWAIERIIDVRLPAVTDELSDEKLRARVDVIRLAVSAYANGARHAIAPKAGGVKRGD